MNTYRCGVYIVIVVMMHNFSSHFFLADNYTKYIGWMLYDKVYTIYNTHTNILHCLQYSPVK